VNAPSSGPTPSSIVEHTPDDPQRHRPSEGVDEGREQFRQEDEHGGSVTCALAQPARHVRRILSQLIDTARDVPTDN